MHASHELLQAAKTGALSNAIGSGTISEFLGTQWVACHPQVWPHIQALEAISLEHKGA
jgi:hypothetical protein